MDRVTWVLSKVEGRILDVGSADGHIFAGKDVVSLDLDAFPIPKMVQGEAERIPFADRSFDTVVFAEIIEHIMNPYPALRELARVCRGKVLITTPDESRWTADHDPHEHSEFRLGTGEAYEKSIKAATQKAVMTTDEKDRPHLYHCTEYDMPLFREVVSSVFKNVKFKPLAYDGWYFLTAEASVEPVAPSGNGLAKELRELLWGDRASDARALVERHRKDHPDDENIKRLSSEVETWLRHTSSRKEYAEFYTSHRRAFMVPETVLFAHETVPRLGCVRELMSRYVPKKILEFGCFDGFAILNLLKAFGAAGTGLDLDTKALDRARELSAGLSLDCQFAKGFAEDADFGKSFDAVLIMELLEHVIDPDLVIRAAARCLSREGRLYITIPGSPVPHFGNEHEAREHVRCLSLEDMENLLSGFKVENHDVRSSPGHMERVIEARRKRCSIVSNRVAGGWSPLSPLTMGGSEESVAGLAGAMVRSGFDVEVFYDPPPGEGQCESEGAIYKPLSDFDPSGERDDLILFKCPEWLDSPNLRGKVVFWTADPNGPEDLTPARVAKVSRFVAISEWHRAELLSRNPGLQPEKVLAFPLGVCDRILAADISGSRDPHSVVYASSFDRGLEVLLDLWPRIRSQVPDAVLHIWYGWEIFDRVTAGNPDAAAWKGSIEAKMRQEGVVFHGRAADSSDPSMFATAAIWAYPCTGGERFCITAVKAQKLGAVPVVVPEMALSETVRYGRKVEREKFEQALVEALKDEAWQRRERARMVSDPDIALSWDSVYARFWKHLHRESVRS